MIDHRTSIELVKVRRRRLAFILVGCRRYQHIAKQTHQQIEHLRKLGKNPSRRARYERNIDVLADRCGKAVARSMHLHDIWLSHSPGDKAAERACRDLPYRPANPKTYGRGDPIGKPEHGIELRSVRDKPRLAWGEYAREMMREEA